MRSECEVLAVRLCWLAKVAKGCGKVLEPFILQQVPLNLQCGFLLACPAAGLDYEGHSRKGIPKTCLGRSNQHTGAKTVKERGDADMAMILPPGDLVATKGQPRLTPFPDIKARLTGEVLMEAKHGCTDSCGGHPWVPCRPLWAVLQSPAEAGMPGMRSPGTLPCRSSSLSGCPLFLRPVARTGYSPQRRTLAHVFLSGKNTHSASGMGSD